MDGSIFLSFLKPCWPRFHAHDSWQLSVWLQAWVEIREVVPSHTKIIVFWNKVVIHYLNNVIMPNIVSRFDSCLYVIIVPLCSIVLYINRLVKWTPGYLFLNSNGWRPNLAKWRKHNLLVWYLTGLCGLLRVHVYKVVCARIRQ